LRSLFQIARKALNLPADERAHVARALGWLLAARVMVVIFPYARVRSIAGRIAPRPAAPTMSVPECAQAFARACRVLPSARCLARSVAAECLLRREGRDAVLTLGVRLDDARLYAHAWLQSEDVIVTGGDEASQYTLLARRSRS
jgi:hypothetical protein